MVSTPHRPPPGICPFRQLPPEIRLLIYPHELILKLDKKPPALLLALTVDPVLYAEMHSIYFQTNDSIGTQLLERTRDRNLPQSLQMRHLHLVWDSV